MYISLKPFGAVRTTLACLGAQAEVITPADFGALAPADSDIAHDAIRGQRALFNARRNTLSTRQRTSS
jgi:hypothetical protein